MATVLSDFAVVLVTLKHLWIFRVVNFKGRITQLDLLVCRRPHDKAFLRIKDLVLWSCGSELNAVISSYQQHVLIVAICDLRRDAVGKRLTDYSLGSTPQRPRCPS